MTTARPAKNQEKITGTGTAAATPAPATPPDQPTGYASALAVRVYEEALLQDDLTAHPLLRAAAKKSVQRFGSFVVKQTGVYFLQEIEAKAGEEASIRELFVCDWLYSLALVRDTRQENWGMSVQFYDADGHLHLWVMPMRQLKAGAEDIRASLFDMGLNIATTNRAKGLLMDFILEAHRKLKKEPSARARTSVQTGWQRLPGGEMVYLTPTSCIGNAPEMVHYTGPDDSTRHTRAGLLDDWRRQVSTKIKHDSRAAFALSVGLASALLYLMQQENSGFNFLGGSSLGKSTLLVIVASLFGKPSTTVTTWNATSNGLEAIAMLANDACLLLDEMKQLAAEIAGMTAYLILNGRGRSRANVSGGSKGGGSWRVNVISSGEIGLADLTNAKGGRLYAGQEQRLADIPADAGKGLGVWDCLGDYETSQVKSDDLKHACMQCHGTAYLAFVAGVAADPEGTKQQATKLMADFVAGYRPAGAESQALRMLSRFALAAAAGELATQWGITGWHKGDAFWAAGVCYRAWLAHRGGPGQQEPQELLKQVYSFFESHGDSRFKKFYQGKLIEDKVIDMYGYRLDTVITRDLTDERHTEYYVLPYAFGRIVSGFDPRFAATVLAEKGLLYKGKPHSTPHQLPGFKVAKYYRINLDAAETSEP